MFTGLVQNIGIIRTASHKAGGLYLEIETKLPQEHLALGASICCSGCCLTVVKQENNIFGVDVSAETLSITTLGQWSVGTKINLEPSLRVGDPLGGHFVSGHVDGTAKLAKISQDGESRRLLIAPPKNLKKFIAPKGSIALDGISLTINEVTSEGFGVNIIPHTWGNTTLGQCKEGNLLNIEVDMLARYVAGMTREENA